MTRAWRVDKSVDVSTRFTLFSEWWCRHLTSAWCFATAPAKGFVQHWITRHWRIHLQFDTLRAVHDSWTQCRQLKNMLWLIRTVTWTYNFVVNNGFCTIFELNNCSREGCIFKCRKVMQTNLWRGEKFYI